MWFTPHRSRTISTGCDKPATRSVVPSGCGAAAAAPMTARRRIGTIGLTIGHRPCAPGNILLMMRFAPEYVSNVLNDNFEDAKALLLTPLMAIHHAHLVMLAEQGIVSTADARVLREALASISLD